MCKLKNQKSKIKGGGFMELFRKLKNLGSAVEECRGRREVDVFLFYCGGAAVEEERHNLSPFIRSPSRKNNLKLSKVFDFYKTKVKKCILAKNRNQAVLLLQKARAKLHIQCCKTVIQYLVVFLIHRVYYFLFSTNFICAWSERQITSVQL